MRPQNLKTKIFLDSGDPEETAKAIQLLGFLDGQTTNPSLLGKHHEVEKRLAQGKKFTRGEIYNFYKQIVSEISRLLPNGSVSIEVYSDRYTTVETMLAEGETMYSWIPNAHIKFPTTKAGLAAAEKAVQGGMRVNMTLVFTQEQAAAVYAATRGCQKGDVYLSPFVGRLDDLGDNGMSLIVNLIQMYNQGDGHVSILTSSVRNLAHLLYALHLESDIITAPLFILEKWASEGMIIPDKKYTYNSDRLKPIPYKQLDLTKNWQSFECSHPLLDAGLEKFAADWNKLIE